MKIIILMTLLVYLIARKHLKKASIKKKRGLKEIQDKFEIAKKTKILELDNLNISDDNIKELKSSFDGIREVKEVNFNENQVTVTGIKYLKDFFLNNPNIKWIYFNNNNLGFEGINELFNILESIKRTNSNYSYSVVDFSKNNIGDKGCEKIMNYILNNSIKINSLDLSENMISDKSAYLVGEVAKTQKVFLSNYDN